MDGDVDDDDDADADAHAHADDDAVFSSVLDELQTAAPAAGF